MGQWNESQNLFLSLVVSNLEHEISMLDYYTTENDKLVYSTCLSDREKEEYTRQEIKKLQKKFRACNSNVAPYITAFINVHPSDSDSYDKRKEIIIHNFITSEYYELFETIKSTDSFEEDIEILTKQVLEALGFNTLILDNFVSSMADAERYIGFVSILDRINDENSIAFEKREERILDFEVKESLKNNKQSILSKKNRLAAKILGYGAENSNVKSQPVFYYIKDILKENKLTPTEAIDIVNDMQGSFSPVFNETVTTKVIAYLKEIPTIRNLLVDIPETYDSKNKILKSANKHPTIFLDSSGFSLFLEWHQKFKDDKKNHMSNYSFLIRSMIKDNLIFDIKHSNFFNFLSEYNISISKLKTISECETLSKKALYLELKKAIKP